MLNPEQAINDNMGMLHKITNKYLFKTPKFDKDELMSEAYLHTVVSCQTYDESKSKPTTYIYKEVDRKVRRFVSKNTYDLNVGEHIQNTEELSNAVWADRLDRPIHSGSDKEPMHLRDMIQSSGLSPDRQAENKDIAEYLHNSVNSLPELERIIIQLHWFDGQTLPQIATTMGVSKQYIHKLEKRGREKLFNKLKNVFE
jgi:RNA polymerase sigma factor (sigma-70 family)